MQYLLKFSQQAARGTLSRLSREPIDQAFLSKELPFGVASFGQPVGIEKGTLACIQKEVLLFEDGIRDDPKWHTFRRNGVDISALVLQEERAVTGVRDGNGFLESID